MLPIRIFIGILILLALVLFGIGALRWDTNRAGCLNGQSFYGDWVVTGAIGDLEFRQKQWGCKPSEQYDRKQFKSGVQLNSLPPISN